MFEVIVNGVALTKQFSTYEGAVAEGKKRRIANISNKQIEIRPVPAKQETSTRPGWEVPSALRRLDGRVMAPDELTPAEKRIFSGGERMQLSTPVTRREPRPPTVPPPRPRQIHITPEAVGGLGKLIASVAGASVASEAVVATPSSVEDAPGTSSALPDAETPPASGGDAGAGAEAQRGGNDVRGEPNRFG